MYAPYCIAVLALLVILVALILYPGAAPKRDSAGASTTTASGRRRLTTGTATSGRTGRRGPGWRAPDMRWWRRPGYAAPLELSLPLHNFQEYLYGYPPASRMPYNA